MITNRRGVDAERSEHGGSAVSRARDAEHTRAHSGREMCPVDGELTNEAEEDSGGWGGNGPDPVQIRARSVSRGCCYLGGKLNSLALY